MFKSLLLISTAALATSAAAAKDVHSAAPIIVSATRPPIDAQRYPGMATILDGRDLQARGATDLRMALSVAAGVDAPPGGDSGPAGAVPSLWGLQEFDAFLLLVDGVPYGGAFNPALPVLDLHDIERIEVLRGAAPVTYGATSFVGVIQAFHYPAGATPGQLSIEGGEHELGGIFLQGNIPPVGNTNQSAALSAVRKSFTQDRSQMERLHGLYRIAGHTGIGDVHLDLEGVSLRQEPYSPHPREGAGLTARFPFDANINPLDAKADQDRLQANLGLSSDLGFAHWETMLSWANTVGRNTRGFLRDGFAVDGVTPNADGFRQHVHLSDVYFNSHLTFHTAPNLVATLGTDWIHGNGVQNSANFEYAVLPSGANAPDSSTLPTDELTRSADKRDFTGLYAQAIYTPNSRLLVSAGVRLNHTKETRSGMVDPTDPLDPDESSSDKRSRSRLSGAAGASYAFWQWPTGAFTGFINYRNTYKPAAVDFGPEGEGEILEPEVAESWEGGFKGSFANRKVEWELSYFDMRFSNLVIRENIGGLPALANAGKERFRGTEFELDWRASEDFTILLNAALHDAKFTDYERLNGSVLQQLAGKQLELSPRVLAGAGFIYAPAAGFQASAVARHIGSRFLNKSNTAKAEGYTTIDASIGYAFNKWTLSLRSQNLTDRRDPVAESELGDAQFYTLPGRVTLIELTREF